MILLALEATASAPSVAVCDDRGRVLGYAGDDRGAGQADRLVALIDAALNFAGLGYRDVDVLAVDRGPGSFTGVRAGVAAARALSLALARPVLAVSALEALAAALGPQPAGTIVAALDARRGEVYIQTFDHRLAALDEPRALTPEDVRLERAARPLHLVGSGAAILSAALADVPFVVSEILEPDAKHVARRALDLIAAGVRPREGRSTVQPLYLRPPDARLPLSRPAAGVVGAAACSR